MPGGGRYIAADAGAVSPSYLTVGSVQVALAAQEATRGIPYDIRVSEPEFEVEIRGLDVYDPTTGEVRPASVKDITAWFINSNYDGTSFFVRHAHFLGGEKTDRNGTTKGPYASLASVLKAEIDPDAWASLCRTTSRTLPIPRTGKIAVKVINHYGDEVLQVFEVGP